MYEQLELMTYPTQTSGASASHARTSASQASKKACKKVSEADCFTKLCDCLPAVGKKIDPDGYSLKMLKIYLALETDLTSRGCCLKWGGYGYSLQWDTLNSKDYGVPQNRERVFIVCYLGNIRGREVFPLQRTDGENPCELKEITQGVSDAQRIYESGGLARTLKGESGGQGGKTGLYAVRFRYTERGEKSREKGRIRRLTPRECWRLQGFPDEYFDKAKAAGISDTQLYKQAGNSVSVPVAKAIGAELRRIELCQGDTNNLKITD